MWSAPQARLLVASVPSVLRVTLPCPIARVPPCWGGPIVAGWSRHVQPSAASKPPLTRVRRTAQCQRSSENAVFWTRPENRHDSCRIVFSYSCPSPAFTTRRSIPVPTGRAHTGTERWEPPRPAVQESAFSRERQQFRVLVRPLRRSHRRAPNSADADRRPSPPAGCDYIRKELRPLLGPRAWRAAL